MPPHHRHCWRAGCSFQCANTTIGAGWIIAHRCPPPPPPPHFSLVTIFKGSNFYSVWKNLNQLCPHLASSASFEVCSMLSWSLLQWNWCWRFAQCSADLASNGTDAGGSTKQMLSIHQQISIFMYRNQLFRMMSIKVDRYCSQHLSLFAPNWNKENLIS